MRIERLTFKEHDTGWELTPTEFFPGVTLLVGASGVGKTRILRAIHTLKAIALERFIGHWGIEWDFTFSFSDQQRYRWRGRFSSSNSNTPVSANGMRDDLDEESHNIPRFVMEELFENGEEIIKRDAETIWLRSNRIPKLSPHESCLHLLHHEDSAVLAAHHALTCILTPGDDPEEFQFRYVPRFSEYYTMYKTLEVIRASRLLTQYKLALVYKNVPDLFRTIVEQYKEVFPSVEDLTVGLCLLSSQFIREGPADVRESEHVRPIVLMKEKGCASLIPQERISSGMWRTLMHLARLALWPDGTVVLIDEFENSLGVNCLDTVTEYLNDNSRRLQFIVTSHHPYVINNIPWKRWKIVTRNGAVVTAKSAEEMGFDVGSRHQAFFKLINLEAYREGIVVP